MGPEPKKKLWSGARARARARFLDEVPSMAFLCPFLCPFDSGGTYGGHKAFFYVLFNIDPFGFQEGHMSFLQRAHWLL